MNRKMIFYTIGQVLLLEAALLLIPLVVSLLYLEWLGALSFLITAAAAFGIGFLLTKLLKNHSRLIYAREGLIIVALAWITLSVVGAFPFVISGVIPSYIDALFETVSGFTTTGATILEEVGGSMGKGLFFWRGFTHWIGGMGVLVFVMAIISRSPDRSMNILKAEMPGPIVDKLVPKAKDTAKILYLIYIGLTVLLAVLLLFGGMSVYDSVVHALATAGTGGFSPNSDSIGSYSPYCQWVIAVFMALFGVNFNIFYLILIRKWRTAFGSGELWTYIIVLLASAALVTYSIYPTFQNANDAIRNAFFHTASVMSTTGFTIAPFTEWNAPLAKAIFITLMFVGGCAGSTAGGIKLTRLIILFKKAGNEFRRTLHPRTATVVRFEGKRMDEETLNGVGSYLAIYIVVFAIIVLLLSIEKGFSFETNFTAAASCFNNIGPVYGNIAANGSFANYSWFSKLVLTFAMLVGRLELYPMLLMLMPQTWAKK